MKSDNFLLIESLFLPQYRNKLRAYFKGLAIKAYPECQELIRRQIKDVKTFNNIDLEIDNDFFEQTILLYKRFLTNRIKAFNTAVKNNG